MKTLPARSTATPYAKSGPPHLTFLAHTLSPVALDSLTRNESRPPHVLARIRPPKSTAVPLKTPVATTFPSGPTASPFTESVSGPPKLCDHRGWPLAEYFAT